jgi:hypothetical protein
MNFSLPPQQVLMSTNTTTATTPGAAPERKRRWPNMSAYGIHFGTLEMPDGGSRLVMVDEQGAWAPLAKEMGFSQSRWFGIYSKESLKLDIPGFSTAFPLATIEELTKDEIRARIARLMRARKDQRVSQMQGRRLSWHPTKKAPIAAPPSAAFKAPATPAVRPTRPAQRTASEPGADPQSTAAPSLFADAKGSPDIDALPDAAETPPMNPETALRQTLFLGLNHAGQEVFESGDGMRFVRAGETVVAKERAQAAPDPMFLRATTNDELVQVATGLVHEIAGGKRLTSDDFIRYAEAVHGVDAGEDQEFVNRLQSAIDLAMRERLTTFAGAGRDSYDAALQLHDGRPPFWRSPGTAPTPLPIAVAMQSLAAALTNSAELGTTPSIIDLTSTPESHSWALSAASVSGGDVPSHDIALAGVTCRPMAAKVIDGVRVTRTDTHQLLALLDKRADDGLTVFSTPTARAGKLDAESRRVLSAVAQHYEISGITDIAPSMMGPGTDLASRLIVVGKKREQPDYSSSMPVDVEVAYDYDTLWNWGETLRAASFGQTITFAEDDNREENRWQAPYIPSSQLSEPQAMSPRNLLGPVRKALADIVQRYGMGIDELLCDKLGWTMEQLEARLDAEQADAVAIGIQALDDGMGFVEADATGLGKGRVAAALALYGKRKGIPVMFMTEKADLFGDFYRDVADIGSLEELGNPFIINNDLIVRDADGNELARSPKREEAARVLACGEQPVGYDLVLATYSQFNREYDASLAPGKTHVARALRDLEAGTITPLQALTTCAKQLNTPDYAALGFTDEAGAMSYELNEARAKRAAGDAAGAAACEARAQAIQRGTRSVKEILVNHIKADMTTLKHQWLYSNPMPGALLIPDESHIAAGETSQTGANLRHLVENAGAVAYSSATFAKDTNNFLLYSRLFPSTLRAANIGDTLVRGGEPMQEIVCAMLAADGRLVRREHDLSTVEFKVSTDTSRQARNEEWANGFAAVLASMSVLSGEVNELAEQLSESLQNALQASAANTAAAAAANGKAKPKVGVQYTNFSSKFYNLSRAFSMAVNADLAADLAIKALREGRKPVITVESTMETVLKELVEGVELDGDAALAAADPLATGGARPRKPEVVDLGRLVSFKDILKAYVDSMFAANEQVRQGTKMVSSKRVDLSTPDLIASAAAIHRMIDGMPDVPLSPMDLVRERITQAGFTVDEISGRQMRLETNADGTHRVIRMGTRNKQKLKTAFNSGALDCLFLSKSGSTGISLHANRTYADQSQRELIELQPAADIAQRLQFWGRVNRKGQVCSPIIHMVSSGLPAEKRLITMQNARLRRMSANISGNADNSAINESAPDIINKIGNEVCFRWMEANPSIAAILGYKIGDMEENEARRSGTKFVDMVTGRMMMLDVATQRRVYQEITDEFNAVIEQFEMEGRNPLKAAEYDLRARKTDTLTLQVATGLDSVFNDAVQATELTYDVDAGALDRAAVEMDLDYGRRALLAEYGEKYAAVLVKRVKDAFSAAAPSLMPKRFQTIEQALLDEKPNALKNARTRFEWLVERLPRFAPGSILGLGGDGYFNGGGGKASKSNEIETDSVKDSRWAMERIFITGLTIPAQNPLSLAGYKVRGYSSFTRKKVEMSMTALMSKPSIFVMANALDKDRHYEREVQDFFDRTAMPISATEKRIVLDGNLYRAAEIAESHKQGAAITYTDDKGVWHHAILMPKVYTMKNISDLPVTIDNEETLLAAVNSISESDPMLMISDDLREGQTQTHTYRLFASKGCVIMVTAGTADQCGWLLNNADMKACLKNGQFDGERTKREGRVLPGMEQTFLRAFLSAANIHGAKVLMGGHMREWYNDYLNAKTGASADAKASLQSVLNGEEDEELDALLATPSM